MVFPSLALLLFGLVLLVVGATALVRGAASLARRLGLTPLVIGLTVVAMGTSAPEMVVSAAAAFQGRGDIALGNVVGSNIFNVAIVLGLTALVSPIHIKLGLLKLDAPLMIGFSLLAVWFAGFDTIPRAGGALLLLLLIGYTVFTVWLARKQADEEIDREFDEGVPAPTRSMWTIFLLVIVGLGLLVLGSDLLVGSATTLARSLGVSEAVIGLTVVAAGTSMPELATSVVAAVRGQPDIAVGNVIGSNTFNILGILGVASILQPLRAPGIGRFDLWAMVGYSIAMLPLLWTGRRLQRWEGALLLAGYAGYLWMLLPGGS